MAERRQKLRGTTLQLDQVIGSQGLLAVDYEKNELRLYDGVVMGGYKFLNAAELATLYTLPARLGINGIPLTGAGRSANEARDNGWYVTDNLVTDQPTPDFGYILTQQAGAPANRDVKQLWTSRTTETMFTRRYMWSTAVWTPWVQIADATSLANGMTAYNATRLNNQMMSYYTNIPARLGYTPVNKAGDNMTGNLATSGDLQGANVYSGNAMYAAGKVSSGGRLYAFNEASWVETDGNLYGAAWGGYIHAYIQSRYVLKTGDTMTGALSVRANLDIKAASAGSLMLQQFSRLDGTVMSLIYTNDLGQMYLRPRNNQSQEFLLDQGHIFSSAMADWGNSQWKDAIAQRIESRAGAYADSRISQIAGRKVGKGELTWAFSDMARDAPSGAVFTGYAYGSSTPRFYYHYLQLFDPVRGWIGFGEA